MDDKRKHLLIGLRLLAKCGVQRIEFDTAKNREATFATIAAGEHAVAYTGFMAVEGIELSVGEPSEKVSLNTKSRT